MDILAIRPHTIFVDLKHPGTGADLGVTLECQSLESDEVKAVVYRVTEAARRAGRNTVSLEKAEQNAIAVLSASIVGWTWADGVTLSGEPSPACTEANKRKLLEPGNPKAD